MATYEITSPSGEVFEVTAPDDATEEQVLAYAKSNWSMAGKDKPAKQYKSPAPEPTAEPSALDWARREANMFARGGTPVLAGATTGAIAGMPAGPLGMGAGAIVGGLGGSFLKPLTDKLFPAPETTGERALEAAGGALAGAGTQLPALANVAANAASPVVRGVAGAMTRGTGTQLAAAAPSAAVGKVVEEKTDSPLLGMLASVVTSAGIGGAASLGGSRATAPSLQDLRDKAAKLYATADRAGVVIKPASFDGAVNDIANTMKQEGFDPGLHPKIAAVLTRLESEKGNAKTLSELDILRRVARGAAGSQDKSERRLATMAIEKIDDFIGGLKQSDLNAGDASVAAPALAEARATWSKVSKADTLERLFEKAKNDAGGKYTQAGLEHALRTRFRQIANNDKAMRQFNAAEQEAIRQIVRGSPLQNVLRGLGKLAPHGAISTAVGAGGGAAIGGPVGAIGVPLAGYAAESAATNMGMNRFRNLDEMIRLGMQPPATPGILAPMTVRGLLSGL